MYESSNQHCQFVSDNNKYQNGSIENESNTLHLKAHRWNIVEGDT